MRGMSPLVFTLRVPPRTKKNHGRRVRRGGKTFTIPSEAYETYELDCLRTLPGKYRVGIAVPVNVKAIYHCDAARRVDLNGLNQALHDMLVKAGVLSEDSAINPAVVCGTDGSRVMVDRRDPRTEITITPL